jgi:hypothetical protein
MPASPSDPEPCGDQSALPRLVRAAKRQQRLPPAAACAVCGARDPCVLVAGSVPLLCYACRRAQDGAASVEAHHLAGRRNSDYTLPLPANLHRVLSAQQQDWPEALRRNPDGSPLIALAAMLRGYLDLLHAALDRCIDALPDLLLQLDACLTQQCGDRWWERPDFAPFMRFATGLLHLGS